MKRYIHGHDVPVMSRDQVRAVDAWAIKTMGIPGVVLMENAGRSCAEFIQTKLARIANPLVVIFCGTGNNGGDGYVVARHLHNANIRSRVIICGDIGKIKGDAKVNLDIITKMGIAIETQDIMSLQTPKNIEKVVGRLAEGAILIVDGIFGTGLQGQLADNYISLVNTINLQGIDIVAIDIPSGLDCDTGQPLGAAVKASATITFVAAKKGFAISPDAAKYTGEVYVASIGIDKL
jgi:hydroxyethylthiazole kinase-like uncharacterized protein yjeF